VNRTAALLAGCVAVVGVVAPSATAAPKPKPITKTYTATAGAPDPTNFAMMGYSVCAQNVPGSFDDETFKVPAAGTLKVELTGYVGDWDLLLMDGAREELANSGLTDVQGAPEVVSVKFKKATETHIIACNWAGGPTGTVKYTFTYK
jgi:hypothetical protein